MVLIVFRSLYFGEGADAIFANLYNEFNIFISHEKMSNPCTQEAAAYYYFRGLTKIINFTKNSLAVFLF